MQLSRKASGIAGLTLLEIMIVVTIVGLLTTIVVTNVIIARDKAQLTTIRYNLRKIDEAKAQWALDNKMGLGSPVADVTVLQNYFRAGTVHQVVSETYIPNAIGVAPEATLPAGVKLGPYGPGAVISAP